MQLPKVLGSAAAAITRLFLSFFDLPTERKSYLWLVPQIFSPSLTLVLFLLLVLKLVLKLLILK